MPSTTTYPTQFGAATPYDPTEAATVRSSVAATNLFRQSAAAAAGSWYLMGEATPSAGGSGGSQSSNMYQRRTGTGATGFFQATKLCEIDKGFSCSIVFKIPTAIDARRFWVGVGSTSPTDSDTAAGHYLGLRFSSIAADAGLVSVARDGTTQNTGTSMMAFAFDVPYQCIVTVLPGENTATIELTNLLTNTTATRTVSSNLPLVGNLLGWICYGHNQAVSKAIEISSATTSVPLV